MLFIRITKMNILKLKTNFRFFINFNNLFFVYFLILYLNVKFENLNCIVRFNRKTKKYLFRILNIFKIRLKVIVFLKIKIFIINIFVTIKFVIFLFLISLIRIISFLFYFIF